MLFQSWHGAVYYEIVRVVGFITESRQMVYRILWRNKSLNSDTDRKFAPGHAQQDRIITKKLVKLYILKVKLFLLSKFLSNLPLEVEALAWLKVQHLSVVW